MSQSYSAFNSAITLAYNHESTMPIMTGCTGRDELTESLIHEVCLSSWESFGINVVASNPFGHESCPLDVSASIGNDAAKRCMMQAEDE